MSVKTLPCAHALGCSVLPAPPAELHQEDSRGEAHHLPQGGLTRALRASPGSRALLPGSGQAPGAHSPSLPQMPSRGAGLLACSVAVLRAGPVTTTPLAALPAGFAPPSCSLFTSFPSSGSGRGWGRLSAGGRPGSSPPGRGAGRRLRCRGLGASTPPPLGVWPSRSAAETRGQGAVGLVVYRT